MGNCKCGCGEAARSGNFIAGHSQKLTANLVNEVGGLFTLQELVQAAKKYSCGEKGQEQFLSVVQRIFPVKSQTHLLQLLKNSSAILNRWVP